MSIIFNPVFLAAILSHFMIDTINGQRGVVFTYLSNELGLSNADLGIISTIYILSASIMQPIFGYMTDKIGPRWPISGGVLWMGVMYTIGVFTPGMAGIVLLIVASMGSGMFHPAGAMQATLTGRERLAGRETTTASLFFLFGQLGLFFGPFISGQILNQTDLSGLWRVTVFTIPVGIFCMIALKNNGRRNQVEENKKQVKKERPKIAAWVLAAFIVMTAFQAWASQNMITFLPKYFSDLGRAPSQYGFMAALFMGGAALGNVAAGFLADRYGKQQVARLTLILAIVPLLFIGRIGWSAWLYLLIPLAGTFIGGAHSIIVVLAQHLIPSGMGFASGLILGFMFASGSLGTLLSGYIADISGFPLLFYLTAGQVLVAVLLTFSLSRVDV